MRNLHINFQFTSFGQYKKKFVFIFIFYYNCEANYRYTFIFIIYLQKKRIKKIEKKIIEKCYKYSEEDTKENCDFKINSN